MVSERLIARGTEFITMVHRTSVLAESARLGLGSSLCPGAIVSDLAALDEPVLMNCHTSLGHDSWTGDLAVMSPYATLGGNAVVGKNAFLGLHATVEPGGAAGARGEGANSCALSNMPPDSIIYGAPGRIVPRVESGLP